MSVTYVKFDASKPIGALLASAADKLIQGRDELNRAMEAINAATDAGTTKDNLINGDFGALDSANAALMWTAAVSVKTLLDGDDAGGLSLYLSSLDKGVSG
jgi:hypothetical protein